MKKLFLLFFIAVSYLFAAIDVSEYKQLVPEMLLGESKVVMSFKVGPSGTDGGGNFHGIEVGNPSQQVPFSTDAVYKIKVYRDQGGTKKDIKDPFDPEVGSLDVIFKTGVKEHVVNFSSIIDIQVTESFYIEYSVSSKANFSDVGNSNVNTQVVLQKIIDDIGAKDPSVKQPRTYSIVIRPSGLIYRKASVQSIVPSSTSSFSPGLKGIPILAFEFLALDQDVTINTIILSGVTNNFGTNPPTNSDGRVNKIKIFKDLGGQEFNGESDEQLVAEAELPTNNSTHNEVRLKIKPTKIKKYNEDTNNGTYFFVVFDVGPTITVGRIVNCTLAGAIGKGASDITVNLLGQLPVGNAEFEITATKLNFKNPRSENFSYPVVAGQRDIKMLEFELDAEQSIEDATIVIRNSKASFSQKGKGVSKVSLYKKVGSNWEFVGSTDKFESSSQAKIKGLAIQRGSGQKYCIKYDLESSTAKWNDDYIACQIHSFESAKGEKLAYSGILSNSGSPIVPARVAYRPARLWVEYVSVNTTQTKKGADYFQVEIGVRNIWGVVDQGDEGASIYPLTAKCQPMFYLNTKDGLNISSEFEVNVAGASENIQTNFDNLAKFTYNVRLSESAFHDGFVVVDAMLVYEDNPVRHGGDAQEVYYLRHYEEGRIVPAARKWADKKESTAILQIISDKTSQDFVNSFPWYIASVNITNVSGENRRVFINNDVIPAHSKMYIYLRNKGQDIKTPLDVEINGKKIEVSSLLYNWHEEGYLEITDIGNSSGTIKISGFSSAGGNTSIEPAYIDFRIAQGFTVEDFYAYPSPLDTASDQECNIGFFCSEEGSATIYIYDTNFKLVHKSEKILVEQGYNVYNQWKVDNLSNNKVGSGAYLIYLQIKGNNSGKRKIYKTKLGIR